VSQLLALRVLDRVFQADEELALKLWGPMGLKLGADALLKPHLDSLFAATFPLPLLLPLYDIISQKSVS